MTVAKANLLTTLHITLACKTLIAAQRRFTRWPTRRSSPRTISRASRRYALPLLWFAVAPAQAQVAHQAFVKRDERSWAAYVISLLSRLLVPPRADEPRLC